MPPMKAKRRAAPPMDAPAMPPPLSFDESWVAAAAEDDCAGGEEEAGGVEDVDAGGDVDAGPVPELVGTPLGPRSEYGAQSGLGNAKGQDGS
jgi:hypothetical protein